MTKGVFFKVQDRLCIYAQSNTGHMTAWRFSLLICGNLRIGHLTVQEHMLTAQLVLIFSFSTSYMV